MGTCNYQPRRVIGVFMLAMINVSLIASLRGIPSIAVYGLGSVFFYLLVAITFLVPTSLISAELATAWPGSGGIYTWVKEAFGEDWGFFSIWSQWIQNVIWFPVALSFAASSLAYVVNPEIARNKLYITAVILVVFWGSVIVNTMGMKVSGSLSSAGVLAGTLFPGIILVVLGGYWLLSGKPSQIEFTAAGLIPDLSNIHTLAFAASIFLLFAGSEVSAVHSREIKNPSRNLPRAIFLGALITIVMFTVVTLAVAIVIPAGDIDILQGIMQTMKHFFESFGLGWMVPLVALMLGLGAIGQVTAWCVGPPQVIDDNCG